MELVLQERSSKGIVKDFYSTTGVLKKETRHPKFIYSILMDMVESDSILFNAVSLTADLTTYNGYDFIGDNEREIKKAKKLFNDTLDFDQVIDNVLWSLIVYGDAYLEVRWNESKTEVTELHPMETTEMVIDFTEKGDIVGYTQKPSGKGKEGWVNFAPDEIIYFRQYWVGTDIYSRTPFKSIRRSFTTKIYANDYLQSIFLNMPPKLIYFLKNGNKAQREEFMQNLIRAKTNPNMDIIAQGDAFDAKIAEVSFNNGLMDILEYLRKEVLMVTRVPPHWVGILDGANRGIGENVVIPYETKIKKLQQKIASQINKELLPSLHLSNLKFKWNAISLMDEKSIIENMGQLKIQMYDDDTVIQYAKDHGLKLRPGAFIKEPEPMQLGGPQIQKDSAPSRQRENQKTDKMGDGMNKKGVSDAGKEKLEAKKVI